MRLLSLLEKAEPSMDATMTAILDTPSIAHLVYIFTKLRPNTRVCDLRAKDYKALGKKFRDAGERVRKFMQVDAIVSRMTSGPSRELDPVLIAQAATENHFQDSWLAEVFDKKKKKVSADSSAGIQQQTLTQTFNWSLTRIALLGSN